MGECETPWRTADLMADDLDALDRIAADVLERAGDGDALRADAVAGQPTAVRRRVLRSWLAGVGAGALTYDHLFRLDRQLTDPGGPVQVRLPGGLDVWRAGPALIVTPTTDAAPPPPPPPPPTAPRPG